jgi:hypothetical protein
MREPSSEPGFQAPASLFPDSAALLAFGDVEWVGRNAEGGGTAGPAQGFPAVGERWTIRLNPHLDPELSTDDTIWLMFLPAAAGRNGWEETPGTLEESGFVEALVEERPPFDEATAKRDLVVKVTDVLPITAIEQRLAPTRTERLTFQRHARGQLTRHGALDLLFAPFDDAGLWLVARPDGHDVHVLAGGEWVLEDDWAWAAHLVIDRDEWRRLCALP